MRRFVVAIALCLGYSSSAAIAATSPTRLVYKTDDQAAAYIKRGLKSWAGIKLVGFAGTKAAICLNGHYSRLEKRTGRHFEDGPTSVSKTGETSYRFASFTCTFSVLGAQQSHSYQLYLRPTTAGWDVTADR